MVNGSMRAEILSLAAREFLDPQATVAQKPSLEVAGSTYKTLDRGRS